MNVPDRHVRRDSGKTRWAALLATGLLFVGTAKLHAQACESPGTVAKGDYLIESDLFCGSYSTVDSEGFRFRTSAESWMNVMLTTGVAKGLDCQLGFEGVLRERADAGERYRHGHGDLLVRAKWTALGTDGESLSVALLPQMRLPISKRGMGAVHCEPALLVPMSLPLGEGTMLGATFGTEWAGNETQDLSASWSGSCYLGKDIGKGFGLYAEALCCGAWTRPVEAQWQGGVGATLQCTSALLLEAALYRGLNSGAPDWSPVVRCCYSF